MQELLTRAVERVYPSLEEAQKLLNADRPLRIYLGVDPTGSHLHLGHTVGLFFLKRLLGAGHKPIFLIGDFTARIGDPTDKDAARKPLTAEEVRAHAATYREQIAKIIPIEKIEWRENSEWWEGMPLQTFQEIKSTVTVQQLIARDMFQRRMADGKPIHAHELDYPVFQGYDTVAMNADGEVGGNDQTFNMLMGRDMLKHFKNREKIVISLKLLADPATGKKMSKTEGTLVSLTDTADNMYGGVMAFSDGMIEPAFEMITDVPMDRVKKVAERLASGENPKVLKQELAFEIVRIYHGEDAAKKAQRQWEVVFSKGGVPEEMPERRSQGTVIRTLQGAGMVASSSEGHRKIREGAVSLNGEVVTDPQQKDKPGDILRVGRKFIRLS